MQKVAFITSDQLIRECNKIPVIKGRVFKMVFQKLLFFILFSFQINKYRRPLLMN